MRSFSTTTNVLVLEDDANDAILIERAFRGAACSAFICRNTSEARAYFLGSGMYADRQLFPFPQLLITDLRLGEESGVEFLSWVRDFHGSRDLPVIVLSGAATPSDILAVQRLRATRVIIKPIDLVALQALVVLVSRDLSSIAKLNATEKLVPEASAFSSAKKTSKKRLLSHRQGFDSLESA